MLKIKSWYCLALGSFVLAGCATNTITNLTARQTVRDPSGLYRIEARWDSNQRSIRPDSLKPYVMVGVESYPMQRTPLTPNRWQVLVPVATNQTFLSYRFKFDYLYDSIPVPQPDSRLSSSYELEIQDK